MQMSCTVYIRTRWLPIEATHSAREYGCGHRAGLCSGRFVVSEAVGWPGDQPTVATCGELQRRGGDDDDDEGEPVLRHGVVADGLSPKERHPGGAIDPNRSFRGHLSGSNRQVT